MSLTSRSIVAGDPPAPLAAPWRWAISVASPLVLTLAFPKLEFGFLSLFALVPLFWFWANSSWKSAFKWGWLSGTIFFFTMFSWMTNSLGDFIGNWKLIAGVLLGGIEGIFFAIVAALIALVCRGVVGALAVFAVPAAWLLVESIRTRGSLGVPFGELGLAAVHMPWLLPVAAFAGVYGLSAVIVSINGALLGIVAGTPRGRFAGILSVGVLIALVAAADISRSRVVVPPPTLRVGIAQGNISQRDKWSPSIFEHTMAVYADLTHSAAIKGAKVVVWPETAVTSYPMQDPSLLSYLERLASANGVWLLAGTIDRPQRLTLYNTVIGLTPKGTLLGEYQKHILVPFAEYLPLDQYLRGLPLLGEASQFVQGPGPTLLRAGGMKFGVLICYESAFSPYAREISNAGADALIIVTDDAWFGETSGPYQHADMAVLDAVETGRWVVRGGDTGISEIIDPTGKIVSRLGLDTAGVVVGDIGPPVDSPYVRWGVLWLLVIAFGVLVAGLLPRENGSHGWRSRRGRA